MSTPAGRSSTGALIGLGALLGLAWAAGFRGYMAQLAGPASHVDWAGTFAAVLLPGAITGALLGWAESLRRRGGRPGWRWLALAPLAFAIAPLLMPGALADLLTQGLGGGAIAISALAIGGGFSLSGRGPLWARILCGALAAVLVAALVVSARFVAGPQLALTEPRGAWVAVLACSFFGVLVLASAIPHAKVPSAVTEEDAL